MSKKKIPKASKKRLAVFGTLSVVIIVYFIFLLGSYLVKFHKLKKEEKKLKEEYTELKADEKELRTEIEKLQDDDYIARYARETYSYSKSGEYILKINEKEEDKEEDKFEINIDYNYILYGGIAVLVIIIIYTIKKKH